MERAFRFLSGIYRTLRSDRSGQIAIIFALSITSLVGLSGAVLDFSSAYVSRQELSNAATLTCQYSTRPPVIALSGNGSSGPANYAANVNSYATKFVAAQRVGLTQTNPAPFTYSGSTSSVAMAASMPTRFLRLFGITTLPINVNVNCAQNQSTSSTSNTLLINESFENSACSGNCYTTYNQAGGTSTTATPANSFSGEIAYVGTTGTRWSGMGYCLEVDSAGQILSTVADGTHSIELDCDNGSHTAGNSSISTKVYLAPGSYQLRYNYAPRVGYPDYYPVYICGSTAVDLAWANNSNSSGGPVANVSRTNQINVYLDQDVSGAPPTHTTIDGSQTLAGASLIDMCVYSSGWIERSVNITVNTAGYYWLSFAADGANDSYGGQVDNVRLCAGSCSGTVKDNFPSSWPNSVLFEDTFESPTYTPGYYNWIALNGALNNSTGTSGTSTSGWVSQAPSGWATAPYNQVNYFVQGAYQGSQYIGIDGNNNYSSGSGSLDRLVSRKFFLDPGYYQVSYYYVSEINFATTQGIYGTFCTAAPSSGGLYPASYSSASGVTRFSNATTTTDDSSNILGVFMSHGALVSTPNIGTTLGATTTFTNPDGSVTTTPTVAPDAVSWSSYNAAVNNPVIDTCGYADSYRWIPRTTYVKITKPGVYWLSFSANGGRADGKGPGIDDVTIKALNSLYGAAPSFFVTIPTPSAAPGSTVAFSGFSIIADPLTP